MATRHRSTNGVYTRLRYIKITRKIGLRNQHRLILVSPRKILRSDNASVSRIAVLSLAILVRVLKHEEKLTNEALQHWQNKTFCWNLKYVPPDTYSSLNLPVVVL